jgi:transcriptional regulator with XRE-family HTH domain
MITRQQLGENIRNFRDAQGLKQEDLAKILNVTREQISNIERGEREISVTNLNKLAELFSIEMHELLEENPNVTSVNLALAFRNDDETESDLESIAAFKRIVLNYLKMQSINHAIAN